MNKFKHLAVTNAPRRTTKACHLHKTILRDIIPMFRDSKSLIASINSLVLVVEARATTRLPVRVYSTSTKHLVHPSADTPQHRNDNRREKQPPFSSPGIYVIMPDTGLLAGARPNIYHPIPGTG